MTACDGCGQPEPPCWVCAPRTTPDGCEAVSDPAEAAESAPLRWADLYGIDPDYCDGMPVDEWLDKNRGEA